MRFSSTSDIALELCTLREEEMVKDPNLDRVE